MGVSRPDPPRKVSGTGLGRSNQCESNKEHDTHVSGIRGVLDFTKEWNVCLIRPTRAIPSRTCDATPTSMCVARFPQSRHVWDFSVALEPFDFQLFNEQIACPANLHTQLFSASSQDENPVCFASTALPQEPGIHPATNVHGSEVNFSLAPHHRRGRDPG